MFQTWTALILMQEMKAQLGNVDIAVNNAGIQKVAPIEEPQDGQAVFIQL